MPHKDRATGRMASRASSANSRARYYGADGILTASDVSRVMQAGQCFYCGSMSALGLDHVIPLHLKGPNRVENLVVCCRPCNASKQRADRPGRWSQMVESCVRCGKSDRPHLSRGMCDSCYRVTRWNPNARMRGRYRVEATPSRLHMEVR